ncbi:hypothetical protein ACP275_08G210600 [Erythranthe tilingii]
MYFSTSQKYLTKVSVSEAKKPVDYGMWKFICIYSISSTVRNFQIVVLIMALICNFCCRGLKYFTNHRRHFDKLVEASFSSYAKDGESDSGFSLSSTIKNFILQRDGVDSS